ncbi:MAG: hypothetical protein K9M54_04675 [Kiritimatiellales bacterium]|nr:hypothetical protein [Kiritimatiellales bacterium]
MDAKNIDLYGQQVEVSYIEYIRGDHIFADADKLKEQIKVDIESIRSVLG